MGIEADEIERRAAQKSSKTEKSKQEPAPEKLTSREIEILNLIFSGRASSEVAQVLCVSKRTIDFHLGKAYAKLGVSNRVQAFKKATELGIISH